MSFFCGGRLRRAKGSQPRVSETRGKLREIETPDRAFCPARLKTDTSIIADLPEKMEMKVFCILTREQASLYEAVAKEALRGLGETEGIQRKGIVLATLSKLKQVCNHPAHFLGGQLPDPRTLRQTGPADRDG